MRFSDELAIKEAVRNGDGDKLAEVVSHLGGRVWFDEIRNVVDDMPGSWRHIDTIGDVVVGNVKIKDDFGRAEVVRS